MIYKNIIYDGFLSNIFKKDVYKISFDDVFFKNIKDNKSRDNNNLLRLLNKRPVFIYSRVDFSLNNISIYLKRMGFILIETDVQYVKKVNKEQKLSGKSKIRFTNENDKINVIEISKKSFTYDRFHQDDKIPNRIADMIKEKWVSNFYAGERGDYMIVAVKKDKIIGFLQLIKKHSDIVIDLIAVEKKYRGIGVASDMIKFAENNIENIKNIFVGTQLSNRSSIKLYEGLGFKNIIKKNVFHYHNS